MLHRLFVVPAVMIDGLEGMVGRVEVDVTAELGGAWGEAVVRQQADGADGSGECGSLGEELGEGIAVAAKRGGVEGGTDENESALAAQEALAKASEVHRSAKVRHAGLEEAASHVLRCGGGPDENAEMTARDGHTSQSVQSSCQEEPPRPAWAAP